MQEEVKETDPTGRKSSDPGAKLDAGKIRYSLIPVGPLRWLARLYTVGAKEYSDHGWKEVPNGEERYTDALMRHLEAYRSGEWYDVKTKVPHVIAIAWNAFAICWFREESRGWVFPPAEFVDEQKTTIITPEKLKTHNIQGNLELKPRLPKKWENLFQTSPPPPSPKTFECSCQLCQDMKEAGKTQTNLRENQGIK